MQTDLQGRSGDLMRPGEATPGRQSTITNTRDPDWDGWHDLSRDIGIQASSFRRMEGSQHPLPPRRQVQSEPF